MALRTDLLQIRVRLARTVVAALVNATPVQQYGRLRQGYRFIARSDSVTVYNVYYWARFANDGRKAIRNKLMIFFLDPDDDPRWVTDWPRKRNTIRPLSKREIKKGRQDGTLVITTKVSKVQPKRFIEAGIQAARKAVPKDMRAFLRGRIRDSLKRLKPDSITIRF